MMHFSRSITQYRSHGRFHREIGSFSRRLFSHSISSKSRKITFNISLFGMFFPIWNALRAKFPHRNIYFHGFNSLPITKCSVTRNKVMNIQKFWEYMLKSSKRGPHARKMKSWILCRLRSTQKYPHFEDFFIDQRRLKFRIFITFKRHVC